MNPANKLVLKFVGVIALIILIGVGVFNLNNQSTERAERAIAQEQIANAQEQVANAEAVKNKRVRIGMTAADIRNSWGPPTRSNRSVYSNHVNEQWIYEFSDKTSYLYIDDGTLRSFEDSR